MRYIAHRKESGGKTFFETLEEHTKKTEKYARKIFEIDVEEKEKVIEAIALHDYGKRFKGFQEKILYGKTDEYSDHSLPSAAYFLEKNVLSLIDSTLNGRKLKKAVDSLKNKDLFFLLSYLISKHHSNLGKFIPFAKAKGEYNHYFFKPEEDCVVPEYYSEESFYKIREIVEQKGFYSDVNGWREKIFRKLTENVSVESFYFKDPYIVFIYSRLFYSLMVSADYYATYDFFQDKEVSDFGRIKNINELFDTFNKKYEKMLNAKNKSEINKVRTELSRKAFSSFIKNGDKRIFFLNAPTGAGKTLISLYLASVSNVKKIFYVFPFNTIVEQTATVFNGFFDKKSFKVINSVTGIDMEKDGIPVAERLLRTEMMHHPLIITSTVNMFEIFFSNKKKHLYNFWQLQNSLIIFDEIHFLPLKLMKPFMRFLEFLTKTLNVKVVLMSATLPKTILEEFVNDKSLCYSLLGEETLYKYKIFKQRVKPDMLRKIPYSDKEGYEKLLDDILSRIEHEDKILIEFVFKRKAKEFFYFLKENATRLKDYKIRIITGDTDKIARSEIIEETKEKGKMILVSTQVIEAGVDIDMDIGFKQISLFESEEQFMGRINRNLNSKTPKRAFFFYFNNDGTNVQRIYKNNDSRAEADKSIRNSEIYKIFLEKKIGKYYEIVKNDFLALKNQNSETYGVPFYYRGKLDFPEISHKMKIIKEEQETLYIPFTLKLKNVPENFKKYKSFIKNKTIVGWEIFLFYKEKVLNNKDFLEKKSYSYYLRELIDVFTFSIYRSELKKYRVFLINENEGLPFFVVDKKYVKEIFDEENRFLREQGKNLFL